MFTIRHLRQTETGKKTPPKALFIAQPKAIKEPVFVSEHMEDIQRRACETHGVSLDDLFSKIRTLPVSKARRDLIRMIHHEMKWSTGAIARYLKMDISTVQYHLGLRKASKVKYGAINAN